MCEEKSCERAKSDLCSCKPVQSGDILQMAIHLAENITDVDWCLTYQTMKDANSFRLCLIGRCRNCGGRLCVESKPFGAVTTDDFLAAAYRHLHQFHHNIGHHLSRGEFRARFVEMFHDEDRAFVKEWLARPENQSVHTMYRRSEKKAYTIVHTSADADQGNFPPPMGLSTFDDKDAARAEFERLVAEEKENMEIPFSKKQYCEEYGDDFWEAYRDGYAAGWFIRYDIIESPLHMKTEKENESCPT